MDVDRCAIQRASSLTVCLTQSPYGTPAEAWYVEKRNFKASFLFQDIQGGITFMWNKLQLSLTDIWMTDSWEPMYVIPETEPPLWSVLFLNERTIFKNVPFDRIITLILSAQCKLYFIGFSVAFFRMSLNEISSFLSWIKSKCNFKTDLWTSHIFEQTLLVYCCPYLVFFFLCSWVCVCGALLSSHGVCESNNFVFLTYISSWCSCCEGSCTQ